MREFRLRTDLERTVLDAFALPLGFAQADEARKVDPPTIGYTVDYTLGEEDEPDTYAFYVVISHERITDLLERAFDLLPDEVHGIIEIGSRDAYRAVDVYMAQDSIPLEEFKAAWKYFEPFLLEDGSIGCGANSDEPFIEVFLDQWKGLSIHVPLMMRDDVERLLQEFGLSEVAQTWPESDDVEIADALEVRPVLALDDEFSPGLDELVLQLRQAWRLELNVDPDKNVDDSGRSLGSTLWHAMVLVESIARPRRGGYASIWATAASLAEMESLIEEVLDDSREWRFEDIYTIDRVAYDERPDNLADLSPKREGTEVHLVEFES